MRTLAVCLFASTLVVAACSDDGGSTPIDAARPDAATIDAASIDAANIDATDVDAASIDAASPDGATPDGATPDGDTTDGAGIDGASPDAASPDAGTGGGCGPVATTLSTYPATFAGTTVGATANFTVAQGVCAAEADWFNPVGNDVAIDLVGLTAGQTYIATVTSTADLALYVATTCAATGPTTGTCLAFADSTGTGESVVFVAPAGGALSVIVDSWSATVSGTFTLSVAAAECTTNAQCTTAAEPVCVDFACVQCGTAFDCATAAAPACDTTGACVAGPAVCTGDTSEPDDGPAAARDLTGAVGTPVSLTGSVCNNPDTEADWYKVTTLAGEGVIINTAFTNPTDLDVAVFDSAGRLEGLTFWKNPEVITLTYLPAGTHYIQVVMFAGGAVTAAAPYTITATRTVAQTCATATDCAATYSTQVYRGACTAGACQFIPAGAGAAGAPCDSADDCTGAICSYIAFEADAQKSVCTRTCTTTADCATLGAGYTCTTGFTTNECVPSCAADLECGANINGTPVGAATWDYFTCTAGSCGP